MVQSVDTETLSMLQEVMEDDYSILVTTYLDDVRARLPQLRSLWQDRKSEELRHHAHSLKGSSSNLGAIPLSELCFQVEHKAKEQQLDGVDDILDQIDAEFAQVSLILSSL